MSRTPITRRIAAIAVALAIPFAAASSAEAYTPHGSYHRDAPTAEQPVSGGLPDGGPVMTTFRSSWS
jgi:hypothetical protein